MGTWSRPLFARVSHGTPADYRVERTDAWVGTGFFPEEEGAGTSLTLEEFMNTGLDCHKILDHMDYRHVQLWLGLCRSLMAENPVLEWVEFHFYSRDAAFPYYLRFSRGMDQLQMGQAVVSNDPAYTGRSRSWREWRAGVEPEWVFQQAKYARLLDRSRIAFKQGRLESTPERTICWWG